MQYRDIEIKIVRMAAPGGWKWTVAINGREREREAPRIVKLQSTLPSGISMAA